MKKLLFILLTTFLSSGIYAQGNNLQFSQVLNYEYSSVSVQGYVKTDVGSLTVPQNKVWKISSGSSEELSGYRDASAIFVNNYLVFSIGNGFSTPNSNTPIWLNSGTYTVYLLNHESTARFISGALSIVEFNIVQ